MSDEIIKQLGKINDEEIKQVVESYRRCFVEGDFWQDFYDDLIASSDEISDLFINTDFDRQKEVVKQGLQTLVMFFRDPAMVKEKMDRLARIHDHKHYKVKPKLYCLWLKCLLNNIKKYDKKCDDNLIRLWKKCLTPGMEYMKSRF